MIVILHFTTEDVLADTVPNLQKKEVMLQEVVVEADNRKEIPGGVAFYPEKRDKKFAVDAMSLLEAMALTELPYDVRKRTVTDAAGNAVNYFIDGQPATSKELKALNPKDVDRIEYFPIPTDARFMGKGNTVNFVMKRYLSGGFSKIDLRQGLDLNRGIYAVNSKLAYKEMTYDAYVAGNYRADNHLGAKSTINYSDFMYNGREYASLSESLDARDNRSRNAAMSAFLKAGWKHRNVSLNVTGGWNWERTPYRKGTAATSYSPDIFNSSGYYSRRSSTGINPYLKASLFLRMPKRQSLSIFMSGQYAHHRSASRRMPENLTLILNGNTDNRASGYMSASYSKEFNDNNTLNLLLASGLEWNNSEYTGTYTGISRYRGANTEFQATFTHIFHPGTSISAAAGFYWSHNRTAGKTSDMLTPRANLSFSHKWNKRSSMRISSNLTSYSYLMDVYNNVIQRRSELLWIKGNSGLKDRIWWQNVLSNTWNPNRVFSISASAIYTAVFHHDMPVWERIDGYDGLVRSVSDNSTTHKLSAGPKVTLRLFNRKLVVSGSAEYSLLKITGIYNRNDSFLKGSFSATWYGTNWYAGASIVPSATVSTYDDIYRDYENWVYELRAGYTYKDLNLKLSAYNPFLTDLRRIRRVETPHFAQREASYSGFGSNVFTFQLVYTLSYGKKVSRSSSTPSQMLKAGTLDL